MGLVDAIASGNAKPPKPAKSSPPKKDPPKPPKPTKLEASVKALESKSKSASGAAPKTEKSKSSDGNIQLRGSKASYTKKNVAAGKEKLKEQRAKVEQSLANALVRDAAAIRSARGGSDDPNRYIERIRHKQELLMAMNGMIGDDGNRRARKIASDARERLHSYDAEQAELKEEEEDGGGILGAIGDAASGAVDTVGGGVSDAAEGVADGVSAAAEGVATAGEAISVVNKLAQAPGLRDGINIAKNTAAYGASIISGENDRSFGEFLSDTATDMPTVGLVKGAALGARDLGQGLAMLGEGAYGLSLANTIINGEASTRKNFKKAKEGLGYMATHPGEVVGALIDPYREAIANGDYSEAAGRGAFDIGSILVPAGAAVRAGGLGGRAGSKAGADLARTGRGTRAAEHTSGRGTPPFKPASVDQFQGVSDAWWAGLTSQQRTAVEMFTRYGLTEFSGSPNIIKAVRLAAKGKRPLTPDDAALVKLLDETVAAGRLPQNVLLTRHAAMRTDDIRYLRAGSTYTDPAHVSTSLSPHATAALAREQLASGKQYVRWNISAPEGTNAAPILNNSLPLQQEILLARDTPLKISRVRQADDGILDVDAVVVGP